MFGNFIIQMVFDNYPQIIIALGLILFLCLVARFFGKR